MKYILDTHVLIWYFENSKHLPQNIINIIDDIECQKYISSVTLWEIIIKSSIGKLEMGLPINEFIEEITNSDLNILQINTDYLNVLIKLPFIHKDPFDRIIVATAIAEGMVIITTDKNNQKYGVPWLW